MKFYVYAIVPTFHLHLQILFNMILLCQTCNSCAHTMYLNCRHDDLEGKVEQLLQNQNMILETISNFPPSPPPLPPPLPNPFTASQPSQLYQVNSLFQPSQPNPPSLSSSQPSQPNPPSQPLATPEPHPSQPNPPSQPLALPEPSLSHHPSR